MLLFEIITIIIYVMNKILVGMDQKNNMKKEQEEQEEEEVVDMVEEEEEEDEAGRGGGYGGYGGYGGSPEGIGPVIIYIFND